MNTEWVNKKVSIGLVSVVVPTFNRSVLLVEAIQSVIAQTYRPIECIIVDDGSTNDTKALIDDLSTGVDDQFLLIYIKQDNAGAQVARNTGTLASNGEFIQYLDSDDLLYGNKLKTQVSYLNSHTSCDGVFADWERGAPNKTEAVIACEDKDLVAQMLTGRCIHTSSFLMRKTIIEKIGAWDINLKRNQEIDFHLRGLMAGANFRYQPFMGSLWRTHNETRIANTTGLKEIMDFYQKWEEILESREMLTPELKKKMANLYFWFSIQNINVPDASRIKMLKQAVQLDPSIPFLNSKGLKWIKKFFTTDLLIRFWIFKYRYHL